MNVHAALLSQQGCEQADRAGASHQYCLRLPKATATNSFDLLPRLRDDRGWLQQHREQSERAIHLDRIVRINPPVLRHVPINLLNSSLGVQAIAAHVPLANGTIR